MDKIILMFVAGGLGTLGRYGLQTLSIRIWQTSVWSTLTVNLVGSFLFGLIWSLVHESRHPWFVGQNGLIVLVGFLGAFTTFSTLAFEAHGLFDRQHWWRLLGYLLAQNATGIMAVALGIGVARMRL